MLKPIKRISSMLDCVFYLCSEREHKWICEVNFNKENRIGIYCRKKEFGEVIGEAIDEVVKKTQWDGLDCCRENDTDYTIFITSKYDFSSPWLQDSFMDDLIYNLEKCNLKVDV